MLFLILLLCNAGLLLWYTQLHPSQATDVMPALGRNVKSLVLLDEIQKDHPTDSSAAANKNIPLDIKPIDDKPLPEIAIVSDSTATPKSTAPEPTPTPAAIALSCHTIGPFTDEKIATNTQKKLEKLNIETSLRDKTESEISGYRVFIPPYQTRDSALANAKRLAEAGIEDYFVITDNELENGISLGLFRDKSGAIRRMAQIRRFDFKPAMEIRHRDKTIYWLDYEQRGEQLTSNVWRSIREETPQLQRLSRECQ